ncbi:MAG: alpha-L-fucosidase [Saprospiraceae bacterium]|nr:alpha-L-fucosidase [Saprospiraceae bacterium]MDW8482811.1 alpha-L-fucosidase [Saprospiraceae bacterium]
MRTCLLLLLLAFLPFKGVTQEQPTYTADWNSLDRRPIPEWWLDAKFGVLISWGVFAVPAFAPTGHPAEWYQHALETNAHEGKVREFHEKNFDRRSYYDLANDFRATLFDPDEWASIIQRSGARYAVLTAKHPDGFCLWPSAEANRTWGMPWNAASIGPRRDVVGEFFEALRKTPVKPGLYYSLYEWFNPVWKQDRNRYAYEHALPQLHELIARYQPWILWADGDGDASPDIWRAQAFLAWLYNQSPVREFIVTNDRWGAGTRLRHGGFYTPAYSPEAGFEHPWEENRSIAYSHGYNRAENALDYSSTQALVLHLIDCVARGGNLMLGIGPDGYGKIPPLVQERLIEMGRWLAINGEAIYGTRRWRTPYQWSAGSLEYKHDRSKGDLILKQTLNPDPGYAVKEVFYTYNPKTNSLYALLPRYPSDGRIILRDIQLPYGADVTLLGSKSRPRIELSGNNTILNLPPYDPTVFAAPYAFVIKIANYGAFVEPPEIRVNYDSLSVKPRISLLSTTPDAVLHYTIDGRAPTELSPRYEGPFSLEESALVRVRAFKQGFLPSREDSARVRVPTFMPSLSMSRQPQRGIVVELVSPSEYTVAALQQGRVLKRLVTSNIELDPSCQQGPCALVWKGYFYVPHTRGYEFFLASDDGSRLDIDNLTIVANDGEHSTRERKGVAFLQQGWHQLRLFYFNSGGEAVLRVSFAPIGRTPTPLPPEALGY